MAIPFGCGCTDPPHFVSFLANLIAVVCHLSSVTALPPAHFILPLGLYPPRLEPHHVGHRKRASWRCFLSNVSLLTWWPHHLTLQFSLRQSPVGLFAGWPALKPRVPKYIRTFIYCNAPVDQQYSNTLLLLRSGFPRSPLRGIRNDPFGIHPKSQGVHVQVCHPALQVISEL
jgi:hypothetical protein